MLQQYAHHTRVRIPTLTLPTLTTARHTTFVRSQFSFVGLSLWLWAASRRSSLSGRQARPAQLPACGMAWLARWTAHAAIGRIEATKLECEEERMTGHELPCVNCAVPTGSYCESLLPVGGDAREGRCVGENNKVALLELAVALQASPAET